MEDEPTHMQPTPAASPPEHVLEAIVLYLDEAGVHHLHPHDAPTLLLGWQAGLHPSEVVADGVAERGFSPFMVHSTSWRMDEGSLVLTYIVGVEPPQGSDGSLMDSVVGRAELARGHVMGPPVDVHVRQVVEHGLRHLAWLIRDDHAVHDSLPDWVEVLAGYDTEPFRAFGEGGRAGD